MTEPTRQRSDVGAKYDSVYQLLGGHSRAIAKAMSGQSGAAKFAEMKRLLPASWAVDIELSCAGLYTKTPQEWTQLCEAFNQHPAAWRERGRDITATNADREPANVRVMLQTVLKHLPADCGLVLDLGCGWGHRMFDLWLGGGPKTAAYWGGERASSGRDSVAFLAGLFSDMRVQPFAFDFTDPDYTPVRDTSPAVAVYTYHAIEQVERLGSAFLNKLIERFPNAEITGIHLEPFGFQMNAAADPAWSVDRAYAASKRYNLDLFEQVSRHPKLKIVDVETGLLDFSGGNSTSALVWRYTP